LRRCNGSIGSPSRLVRSSSTEAEHASPCLHRLCEDYRVGAGVSGRDMPQWNPEEYAKHSTAQLAWARELIARLKLRGDESLLDVGSGDGKVTAEIAVALPRGRVVGLDGSSEMAEFARAHYDAGRFPNL